MSPKWIFPTTMHPLLRKYAAIQWCELNVTAIAHGSCKGYLSKILNTACIGKIHFSKHCPNSLKPTETHLNWLGFGA